MTRRRILAGWSIGLLMGVMAAGTAFGAESGWKTEDGVLKFVDSKGNYVTNEWRIRDGKSYFLGSDGEIEKSTWIENTYYVDDKGVMVKNSWVHTDGKDGLKEEGWYFLGKNGKTEEGWKNVGDGRYNFDSDGKMRTGWFYEGDNIYYLGGRDDGAMRRGWVCLEFDEDDLPEIGDISKEYKKADENSRWFFFQNNGKAKRSLSGNYDQETIHGEKFYFDQNGAMLTGWHAVKEKADSDDATGISRFVYLGGKDDGAIAKGQWKQLSEHPGDSDDGAAISMKGDEGLPKEGDKEWYYFENNGTPAYLKTGISTMNAATVRVDGENYFVNQYGCRRNGLVKIVSGGRVMVGYFGEKGSDGRMLTGRNTGIVDDDGKRCTFYFNTSGSNKGAGFSGEKDGFLYYNGLLVTADGDSRYEVYKVDGKYYLVNGSGKVQTNEKAYKSDGDYVYLVEDREVYYTDDSGRKTKKADSGATLPDFTCDQVYEL